MAVGICAVAGVCAGQAIQQELQEKCEGYKYEPMRGSKPFLLMFYDGLSIKYLADRADKMAKLGFDGFLLGNIMPNQTSDVWATDGKPATVGKADETFQTARRANAACRRAGLKHNFMLAAFSGELPDWFDGLAWAKICDNFRQGARFARAAGFVGIAIDSEYVGEQYQYFWPGYTYRGYTTADLRRAVRKRMSEMAAAMYREWPDMEFYLVHGWSTPISLEMMVGWVEEAASRDAPGGLYLATEGTYSACSVSYILADAIDAIRAVQDRLSPRARSYWHRRCGMSPGGWPLWAARDFEGKPYKGARLSVEQFRAMMAGLNMASRKYAWIYPNGPSWWQATKEDANKYGMGETAALPPVPEIQEYVRIARTKEQVADPLLLRASRASREMSVGDADKLLAALGYRVILTMGHPLNQFGRAFVPASDRRRDWTTRQIAKLSAERDATGRTENITKLFGLIRDFSVIGPFSNERWEGHARPYPPEERIDLGATYEGMAGPVKWQRYTVPDGQGYLDFETIYKPKDWTVAYALCYVHSPKKQEAQLRVGTNDAVKMWFNGKLVDEWQTANGRWAVLDDDIAPVTLPDGESQILVKVAQTTGRWGMYLRVTDKEGRPLKNITVSAVPQ
jgi:hypothetical protein